MLFRSKKLDEVKQESKIRCDSSCGCGYGCGCSQVRAQHEGKSNGYVRDKREMALYLYLYGSKAEANRGSRIASSRAGLTGHSYHFRFRVHRRLPMITPAMRADADLSGLARRASNLYSSSQRSASGYRESYTYIARATYTT